MDASENVRRSRSIRKYKRKPSPKDPQELQDDPRRTLFRHQAKRGSNQIDAMGKPSSIQDAEGKTKLEV